METYIKNKINDITYMSELILDIFGRGRLSKNVKDLIRTYNLLIPKFRGS